ncbi:MAG TPA: hypothetical protein VNW52_06975 [Burkholderiaceae bacterium]|jgi:hypothetical protein|nr:hypothetical protein [Burkholderiaceae bacterium]
MMQTTVGGTIASPSRVPGEHRNKSANELTLIEIDRATVVDSIRLDDGFAPDFEPDGVFATGAMRELCPSCQANHLKLVLRQKHVRHAHLYCENCDKCFDARNPNGSSALELDE